MEKALPSTKYKHQPKVEIVPDSLKGEEYNDVEDEVQSKIEVVEDSLEVEHFGSNGDHEEDEFQSKIIEKQFLQHQFGSNVRPLINLNKFLDEDDIEDDGTDGKWENKKDEEESKKVEETLQPLFGDNERPVIDLNKFPKDDDTEDEGDGRREIKKVVQTTLKIYFDGFY